MVNHIISLSRFAVVRKLKTLPSSPIGAVLQLFAGLPLHNLGLEDHLYCKTESPLDNR